MLNRRKFVKTSAFGLAATTPPTMFAQAPAKATSQRPTILVDARPTPIAIDPDKTAVLVVDMQNDFGAKGGFFDRVGIDLADIQRVVAPTAKVLAAARRRGITIVYLKMAFRSDLSDLGSADSKNRLIHVAFVGALVTAPNGRESRILIRDTWNTDIVNELAPQPNDLLVYKNRFSGFFETELDQRLKALGVKHLIVTGCTTSVCVESTIRDAMFRDYTAVLLEDCTAEPVGHEFARTNHTASLLAIETTFGWISDSGKLTKALDAIL